MKRVLSFIVLSYCICNTLFCQEYIQGQVLDSLKRPIAYASVYFENSKAGGITNEEGEFKIKMSTNRLVISSIGFMTAYLDISSLNTLPVTVILKPAIVHLGEVIVKPTDVLEIILKVKSKLPINYPANFIKINGIFKQLTTTNGKQNTYLNADINAYLNVLAELKNRKIITTLNSYSISKNKNEKTVFSEPSSSLFNLFLTRNSFFSQTNNYKFKIQYELEYQNMNLFKIGFEPIKRDDRKFQFNGSIYVDKATDAIIFVESELLPVSKTNKNILFGISQKQEMYKYKILFEKWNNKFVPKYIISESQDVLKVKKETIETHNIFNFFSKNYENYDQISLPTNQSLKSLLFKSNGSDFDKAHKYVNDFILETSQEKQIKMQNGE